MEIEAVREIQVGESAVAQPTLTGIEPAPVDPGPGPGPGPALTEHVETAERRALDEKGAPHGLRKDGTPAKKRGRKPGQVNDATDTSSAPAPAPAPMVSPVDYAQMARQLTNLQLNIAVNALGPDWKPNEEAGEAKQICAAWESYLRAKNVAQLSPEMLLLVVQSCYVLPRLPKPETKSRIRRFIEWTRDIRGRFGATKAE